MVKSNSIFASVAKRRPRLVAFGFFSVSFFLLALAYPNPSCAKDPFLLKCDKGVLAVAFSPDGKTLASASYSNTVKLWDVATRKLKLTLTPAKSDSSVTGIAFSLDGKTLASVGMGQPITLWDVRTGKKQFCLDDSKEGNYRVALSPNGKLLAANGPGSSINLWDLSTKKRKAVLKAHDEFFNSYVTRLSFSPDSKRLASSGRDGRVILWDVAKETVLFNKKADSGVVHAMALSPDWKTLASAGDDRMITFWDTATGKKKSTWDLSRNNRWPIEGLAFSPNGQRLGIVCLLFDVGFVHIYNMASGKKLASYVGHTGHVPKSIVFSADGKHFATGGLDAMILWKVPAKK